MQATMREQHIFFGLEYQCLEDDIAHLKGTVRYMQLLALHRILVGNKRMQQHRR